MNYKNEIIFDRENNVKIVVKKESVLFIFLPTNKQSKYECAEINKDNNFSMDNLFNLWKEKNYPLHMLDIINRVSLNLYASEFDYAHHMLPSSVVDQSDVNAEYAIYQSAKFGDQVESYENLKKVAKLFKEHCEKESFIKSDIATNALKIAMPSSYVPNGYYFLYLRSNENDFAVVNHLPENILYFIDKQKCSILHDTYYKTNIQNEVALEDALNDEFYGENT